MRKHKLTTPELLFIVGTRVLLAVGVSLLLSDRLSKRARKIGGSILVGIGIITTPPAAMKVLGKS
jgi:hypothetical protein